MTREIIFAEVQEIFRAVFEDKTLIINDSTNAADIEDWDSLEQINLLVAMEKKYSIKFNIKEVTGLRNVGDMMDVIERKLP